MTVGLVSGIFHSINGHVRGIRFHPMRFSPADFIPHSSDPRQPSRRLPAASVSRSPARSAVQTAAEALITSILKRETLQLEGEHLG